MCRLGFPDAAILRDYPNMTLAFEQEIKSQIFFGLLIIKVQFLYKGKTGPTFELIMYYKGLLSDAIIKFCNKICCLKR